MTIKYTTPADIPELRQLWKEAFGDSDRFLDNFFAIAYAPERSLCLRIEGQLAGALYWFDCRWGERKLAYVYAVATHRKFQGQGVCTKLLRGVETRLKKQGYYGIFLVPASRELHSFYLERGYAVGTTLCHFDLPAAGAPDPELRQITWEKYVFYRAQLLPKDSVLPGEEAFRFLDTYQGFYRCAAGIFCGAVEETDEGCVLRIQEFLGEPKGIFTAISGMGCRKALVRLRGGAPFGLIRYLTREKENPAYFGLPLD